MGADTAAAAPFSSVAGRPVSSGLSLLLRLAERWPWAAEITAAATRLQALPSG
jgi:hypothetical protein